MARAVVTREIVFAEADSLSAAGEDPSIIAVQARIGGGSYSTVKRFLDTWRAERTTPTPRVAVPEQVTTQGAGFVQNLWATALTLADQQALQIRAEIEREMQVVRTQFIEAEQIIARLENDADAQRAQLATVQQQAVTLQVDLEAARAAVQVRGDAQIQDLQQQGATLLRQLEQQQGELRQERAALVEQARLEGELSALRQQLIEQRAMIERLSSQARPSSDI